MTERDWDQFHSPKNLSMSIAVEAAELMEIFQWLTEKESFEIKNNEKKFTHVKEEVADVFILLVRLCEILKIDLEEAFWDKMQKNAKKYPVNKCKGTNKKYDELV